MDMDIWSFILGRIAVQRTQMRPSVTDGVAWSVFLSVTRREPCKNRWIDRDAVWLWTRV